MFNESIKTNKTIPTWISTTILFVALSASVSSIYLYTHSYVPISPISQESENKADTTNVTRKNLPPASDMYEIRADGIYYTGRLTEGADPKTFEYLGGDYAKDKNHAYIGYVILVNADTKTFSYIGGGRAKEGAYAKDKSFVYQGGCDFVSRDDLQCSYDTVTGVDPKTFESVGDMDSVYAKDKNHVYWAGSIIRDADPKTFTIIVEGEGTNYNYSKDANQVYYYNKVVVDADPKTFRVLLNAPGYDSYAKDVMHVYKSGKSIEGADPVTFQYIGADNDNYYAKDKYYVYRLYGAENIIKGIDPMTCTKENLKGCKLSQ